MKSKLLLTLESEIELLNKAADILNYSYENCKKIGIKEKYSYEELDKFESFTSRFARMSDFLIQRIFKLIDNLDLESEGTVRDTINRAEKKELIESADAFVEIRILRNQISHEYVDEEIHEIFQKVQDYTPALLDSVSRIKNHVKKYESL